MIPRPTVPAVPPSTARHPREHLHRFVNQLNIRYNVGLSIPDPKLSLLEKKADQSPASIIYRRLEIHFYTGGMRALDNLLCQFDTRAKEFGSDTAFKPHADAETLPAVVHLPRAASLPERNWIQTVFIEVLDKAQPTMQSSRSFGRTQSGPAAFGGDASSDNSSRPATSISSQPTSNRANSKRQADADMRDVTKKIRADPDPIRDLTASSSSRRHQAAADTSASAFGTMHQPRAMGGDIATVGSKKLPRSFASASTGLSECSAVFSDPGEVPIGTQDTIEASSQEQRRPALTYGLASFSQDSYDLTPSLEEGLRESFNHPWSLNADPAPGSGSDNNVCTSHSPVLTALPSDVEKEAVHRASDFDAQHKAKDQGLSSVWPVFPNWLQEAPFPVAWEVTRIGQSCGIEMTSIDLTYSPAWTKQKDLRASLWRHPAFQGKPLPAPSSDVAWAAGLRAAGLRAAGHDQSSVLPFDQQVVYTASLDFGRRSTLLQLTLQPLKIEQSHRLGRHYGADRFLELLIPSPDSSNLPASLKSDALFSEKLVHWLGEGHAFCGRFWKAFYTKSGGSRKPVKDLQFGPDSKTVFKDRIYFFAEYAEADPGIPRERLSSMWNWALNLRHKDNGSQPVLKLFQRISLVLSRTSPTVVFEPHQITHHEQDYLSEEAKNVMNDGVARMSPAVARKIRASLGLTATPSAIQGRLGSAKGMWILDTRIPPSSDQIWIETFPSQRKWKMDWSSADEEHRTLEIRGFASMPKSASFNLQFLPVIEDRAVNKALMREAIGNLLKTNLRNELDGQKRALQTPLQFRQWTHENATHKHDRIIHGHVPYLGGMPQEDEEVMNMMLDAGFDCSNEFLNGKTWSIQKRKCDVLRKKLNIKVGRSVYLYMVVDFQGVLEEGQVHVGFSSAFAADEEWSKTMLHGTDVLVARSPAHFISDIQKVKAVFRPELADLTDVIVFSSKGNISLADKLSGGDYDGDLAWVCWDPRIVDNFVNAPVQEQSDLSQFMSQDKESLRGLLRKHEKSLDRAVRAMLDLAFEFNLSKSMLGSCTNYKERLCYARNSVCDKPARVLSTLLSNLVDQPKQGLRFTPSDFRRLQKHFGLPQYVDGPIYKLDHLPRNMEIVHIIDHLKFLVAKPTIDKELESFHDALETAGSQHWDKDLAWHYQDYEERAKRQSKSAWKLELLRHLKVDIETVHALWDAHNGRNDDSISFTERVARTYLSWQGIQPREEALDSRADPNKVHKLLSGGELSKWELLKASTAFWMYCNTGTAARYGTSPRFVWQMACAQLCWIKVLAIANRSPHGAAETPRAVIPSIFASLRPDAKFVKQVTARLEGGSQFGLDGDVDDNDGDDDDDKSY